MFLFMKLKTFSREAVESSYSGPVLEDGQITKEFVEEMLECFKDQKKIHRKFAYQVWYIQSIFFFLLIFPNFQQLNSFIYTISR